MTPFRRAAGTVLLALVATGCGQAETGVPQATDRCGEVTFPQVQFGSHLLGDSDPPVPYSSTPPTSGWHLSGAPPQGVFDDPLSEPAQVSALEAGGVVVTHHDLPADELAALTAAVEERWADRVVVTPYDGISPGTTAFTSWGAMQTCDGVDLDALASYTGAYASTDQPHHPDSG